MSFSDSFFTKMEEDDTEKVNYLLLAPSPKEKKEKKIALIGAFDQYYKTQDYRMIIKMIALNKDVMRIRFLKSALL